MTPEHWQKIKAILDEVLELPAGDRDAFLASACQGDHVLRAEVESMLEFESSELDPLFSFTEAEAEAEIRNVSPFIGKTIGKYRVLEKLGSGGMGTVFLAERADDDFDQKVALKLIKRGMDSDAVLRRFLNERRILASLEHPFIARLLDGGSTEDGLPYFVMEYIEGQTIVEHSASDELKIEDKLRLFRDICSAVSFAHQNLIIHRDLKPSNIMVTAEGSPKLLDFGIAKVTSAGSSLITATQQFVFTPDYASPEQVRGEQLTTASDIYSLGVILYEILAGRLPYKTTGGNFIEILKTVTETEAQRPSAVTAEAQTAKDLRGDLDNIVLKCIRKEPERRYSSIEQLSADIDNYLNGRPVSASSDSWRYRSRKFIRRNVYAVAAVGIIMLSLVGGMGATLYQAEVARRERERSEKRFKELRQLTSTIMFDMNDKIRQSPIKARELLVTKALEYLERLLHESDNDPEILKEVASAYEKIGEVQSSLFDPALGKSSEALESHKRALEIREKIFADSGGTAAAGNDVMRSRMFIADVYMVSGEIIEGRNYYQSAISLGEALIAKEPDFLKAKQSLASCYARYGQAVLRSGSLRDALESYQKALKYYEEVFAADPSNTVARRSVGVMHTYIGYVKLETLEFAEATRYFRRQLKLGEELSATDPGNMMFLEAITDGHYWLAVSLGSEGRTDEALEHIDHAIADQENRADVDAANIGFRNAVADSYLEKGRILVWGGRTADALNSLGTAVGHYEAVIAADGKNLSAKRQLAFTRRYIADALVIQGDTARALTIYGQIMADTVSLTESDPDNTEWQGDIAIIHLKTGEAIAGNDRARALEHFRRSAEIFEKLSAASPENARIRRDLDSARENIELHRGDR